MRSKYPAVSLNVIRQEVLCIVRLGLSPMGFILSRTSS